MCAVCSRRRCTAGKVRRDPAREEYAVDNDPVDVLVLGSRSKQIQWGDRLSVVGSGRHGHHRLLDLMFASKDAEGGAGTSTSSRARP
jgi:hypothetical protein